MVLTERCFLKYLDDNLKTSQNILFKSVRKDVRKFKVALSIVLSVKLE